MVKNVIVTFEFDTETDSVTNVQCSVDGIEKKKRTTKKKSEVVEEMASEAIITLETTKLVFNNKAVADMALTQEDRVFIKWEQKGKTLFPIIGTDEEVGNKFTKSGTVAYKGAQNAVLAEIGSEFTIKPYKEGTWELIPTNGNSNIKEAKEVIAKAERIDPVIIVDDNEDTEVDKFTFTI